MRFALSNESPTRLLVVCDSPDEHTRLRTGVGLVGRRATQARLIAELSGLPTQSENLTTTIDDLLADVGRIGLKIALSDLTGEEQIFATSPRRLGYLERVSMFVASVLSEERPIEEGLTAGIWQAERAPARHPTFRRGAEEYWQSLANQLEHTGVLGLPQVAVMHDPYAL